MFLGCRSFLCSGCFITCMEAHFPAVELNNAIRSINHFRVSWFLCHSSFNIRHFLLYSSGLEVLLARSLNTKPNHVTAMLQLHPSLNHQVKLRQLFWCILIDRYLTPAALSWTRGCLLNFPAKYVNLPENSAESLGSRIHSKSCRNFSALACLCCQYIFYSLVTCLTLSFNTAYVQLHPH